MPKFYVVTKSKWEEFVNYVGNKEKHCVDTDDQPGYMNMRKDEFSGKAGFAYRDHRNPDIIVLHVHSNLSYSMRIVKQSAKPEPKPAVSSYPEGLFL